ncbi:MAG: glycine zipper 2TM domain-containing protein [Sphingobium sp.]
MAIRPLHTRILLGLCAVATLPLAACNSDGYGSRPGYASDRNYDRSDRRNNNRRDHYMRDNDRIYRDRDGRYYCKKPDGSTGLIVGGLAGGVLGNVIAPGGSKTLGTILGAGAGAIAGRAIDRNNVRCE